MCPMLDFKYVQIDTFLLLDNMISNVCVCRVRFFLIMLDIKLKFEKNNVVLTITVLRLGKKMCQPFYIRHNTSTSPVYILR